MSAKLEFKEEMFLPAEDNLKEAEQIVRPSVTYWRDVWRRLLQNKLAMVGLAIIVLLMIMSIVGP